MPKNLLICVVKLEMSPANIQAKGGLMYEIHIAVPQTTTAILQAVIARLGAIGMKTKHFLQVLSIPADGTHQKNTPPTGHDLACPAVMASLKVKSMAEAFEAVGKGMVVLREENLKGNFEIEEIISSGFEGHHSYNFSYYLPQFQAVPDSPAFENHVVWKGSLSALPSCDKIVAMIQKVYGYKPHQIVDFARGKKPGESDSVSRVATIYQPDRATMLACNAELSAKKDSLKCSYIVAEKVHIVGELHRQIFPSPSG